MSRFSDPDVSVQDYHVDLLIDLLNRRPELHVDEHPAWFDDSAPEPYLELVDLGLIAGMTYTLDGGGLAISLGPKVTLTDEGRRLAEAARRRRTVGSIGVFVSYVHDDDREVNALCSALEAAGVRTWRDVDRLLPGDDWKTTIRRAIENGAGFIACFSQHSEGRARSYMREEIILAVEQLRLRPTDSGWFMPVLLSDAAVPDTPIGAGRSLRDLQFLRWYEDPDASVRILLAAIERLHVT
ncbi:toll/interleukin-1 receptor domain-containing protein [Micromonospora sp. CPCC 205371]|nr:toll/interleukin-1 receptor domain-containing protein [Micromonospora sp. CPCC 205371]